MKSHTISYQSTMPWTGSELKAELRQWLRGRAHSHFVTLSSNHQNLSYTRIKDLLKGWDARVNRSINGRNWQKRPDERLIWFAFPEKLEANPHWHLLVSVDGWAETPGRAAKLKDFPSIAETVWMELCRQGSFDVQRIENRKVINYVTKACADPAYFEKFVLSRECMNL